MAVTSSTNFDPTPQRDVRVATFRAVSKTGTSLGTVLAASGEMLESIREALVTVQNELTNSVQRLRSTTSPTVQRCSTETLSSLVRTQAGSNLLLKVENEHFGQMARMMSLDRGKLGMRRVQLYQYQLSIEMIEQMNDENIRLANLCSTRMGRAQQMCNERAEAVMACYAHLRSLKQTIKELNDLNRKIDKLNRFCAQTQQAMTHLEALQLVGDTEADIAAMKSDLKKEKAKITNFLKFENDSPDGAHSSLVALHQDDLRLQQDQFDAEKERLEEVALEEFLSNHENEG